MILWKEDVRLSRRWPEITRIKKTETTGTIDSSLHFSSITASAPYLLTLCLHLRVMYILSFDYVEPFSPSPLSPSHLYEHVVWEDRIKKIASI